jgi:hypothetical protein
MALQEFEHKLAGDRALQNQIHFGTTVGPVRRYDE